MMLLGELIKKTDWKAVQESLLWYYPELKSELDALCQVYGHLQSLAPHRMDAFICIEYQQPKKAGDELSPDVYGREKTVKDDAYWVLDFEPWEHWLGMKIDETTRQNFDQIQIIALCFYEMTFLSYDQEQIQKKAQELREMNQKIDQMTPQERQKHFIPLNEI